MKLPGRSSWSLGLWAVFQRLLPERPKTGRIVLVAVTFSFLLGLLHARSGEIPLEAELDAIRSYLAIQKIRFEERLEVTWEVSAEAEAETARLSPDVVFLDIRMPGASGFDLVERIPAGTRVVFATDYSEYALRAFEANALDYLMKPVPPERLATAVRKLLDGTPSAATADGRTTLVGRSLKEWEELLPPRHFLRVHRSTIGNVDPVERIEPWFKAGFRVRLRGLEEPVEVSRRHAALLRERLV